MTRPRQSARMSTSTTAARKRQRDEDAEELEALHEQEARRLAEIFNLEPDCLCDESDADIIRASPFSLHTPLPNRMLRVDKGENGRGHLRPL
jgi:hypothetical protein